VLRRALRAMGRIPVLTFPAVELGVEAVMVG